MGSAARVVAHGGLTLQSTLAEEPAACMSGLAPGGQLESVGVVTGLAARAAGDGREGDVMGDAWRNDDPKRSWMNEKRSA
jgi:hypothetical protein